MKDNKTIAVILRAYSMGNIGLDDAIYHIINAYKKSKQFNYNSFKNGFVFGIIFTLICLVIKDLLK